VLEAITSGGQLASAITAGVFAVERIINPLPPSTCWRSASPAPSA